MGSEKKRRKLEARYQLIWRWEGVSSGEEAGGKQAGKS